MKKLGLFILTLGLFSSMAFAGGGQKVRYTSTYSSFDHAFSTQYVYSERSTYSSCHYNTCYDNYRPSDRVYIEETVITEGSYNGYTKVTVYETKSYERQRVTYYTHNRTVVRREFHYDHPTVHHHYEHSHYHDVHYDEVDFAADAIVLGARMIVLGADVLDDCDHSDNEGACVALALASSASGLASSVSASLALQQKTELEKRVEELEKENAKSKLNIE